MVEWIKNLKEGDLVFINFRYSTQLKKVEKITPAGNIKVNGLLFNSNGNGRGGSTWDKGYLSEATPEAIKDFREKATIKKALKLMSETKNITLEQATKIIEVLECKSL
ncbi:MAG: hypothetical protein UGF89_13585 [Acutalibacteraceae bacterium]|nr:hypothetical protein [Acutalibacteraceae bacterium]